VSAARPPVDHGGGWATAAIFGFSACVLGLLGGLPIGVGPAIGAAGVIASTVWRADRPRRRGALPLAPALVAVLVLSVTAAPAPSTLLFAGLTGLSFLLWVADDPTRPSAGGRRAMPTIAVVALGVALAWSITLALPGRTSDVALAGALLAVALVVLALLLARLPASATLPSRNA